MGPSGHTWSRLPPFCIAEGCSSQSFMLKDTDTWLTRPWKNNACGKRIQRFAGAKFWPKAHARRAQLCSQLHLLTPLPCYNHVPPLPPPPGSESCVLQALAPAPVLLCEVISEGTQTSIISQVPLHPPCLFGYSNHVRHTMGKRETNTMTCGKRLRFPPNVDPKASHWMRWYFKS